MIAGVKRRDRIRSIKALLISLQLLAIFLLYSHFYLISCDAQVSNTSVNTRLVPESVGASGKSSVRKHGQISSLMTKK